MPSRKDVKPTPVEGTDEGKPVPVVIAEEPPPRRPRVSDIKARNTGSSRVVVYVLSVIALCLIAVTSVIFIAVMLPGEDNTSLIATILGVFTPVIAALLAAMIRELHAETNSRLDAYLELTARASRAEGVRAEQERIK